MSFPQKKKNFVLSRFNVWRNVQSYVIKKRPRYYITSYHCAKYQFSLFGNNPSSKVYKSSNKDSNWTPNKRFFSYEFPTQLILVFIRVPDHWSYWHRRLQNKIPLTNKMCNKRFSWFSLLSFFPYCPTERFIAAGARASMPNGPAIIDLEGGSLWLEWGET